MAMTANGLIAKEDDDVWFVSKNSWKSFEKLMKKCGNMIIGRRTYEISVKDGTFPYSCFNVVMTKQKIENKWGDKVVFTNKKPEEVLRFLKKKGFKTAFIGGGGTLNASFMKEGLVDEIYLDVEPVVLGKGIRLFADSDFEAKLRFIEIKKLSKNEVQLHYKVVKQLFRHKQN